MHCPWAFLSLPAVRTSWSLHTYWCCWAQRTWFIQEGFLLSGLLFLPVYLYFWCQMTARGSMSTCTCSRTINQSLKKKKNIFVLTRNQNFSGCKANGKGFVSGWIKHHVLIWGNSKEHESNVKINSCRVNGAVFTKLGRGHTPWHAAMKTSPPYVGGSSCSAVSRFSSYKNILDAKS